MGQCEANNLKSFVHYLFEQQGHRGRLSRGLAGSGSSWLQVHVRGCKEKGSHGESHWELQEAQQVAGNQTVPTQAERETERKSTQW